MVSQSPSPQVMRCRLLKQAREQLELSDEGGGIERLPLANVLAVGVGIVAFAGTAAEAPRKVLIIDLVTAWGSANAGPMVRRLTSDSLAPQRFYPAVPPKQGYTLLLNAIVGASGATVLPDAAAVLNGIYRSFADLAAFEAAVYAGA